MDFHTLVRKFTWKESKFFWAGRRAETFVACNGICWFCGYLADIDDFTIDHIIPKEWGGSDELYNLRLAHNRCHMRYHRGKAIGNDVRK